MEKNKFSPQGRRFSLNATNMASPIAESTLLNGPSSQTHFQWGGTRISPKSRSNSINCLHNKTSSSAVISAPKMQRSPNSSRIDPKIYADVQSKGLASRIVKYHDSNTRLNRSLSINSMYKKPGQFPVVHLKKTEIPYKASRNIHQSSTRIGAPEKAMFTTMSNASRYRSLLYKKSDEEISRENRPILHPPPTANEIAPTPSVLEVLKEISRKRINSDELDGTDGTKKYCNREVSDNLDSPFLATPIRSNTDVGTIVTNIKRQREQTNYNHNGQNDRRDHMHLSPEQRQAVKKRMFSYNNDITSSLSSSMISANKRKFNQNRISCNGFENADLSVSKKSTQLMQNVEIVKQNSMQSTSKNHATTNETSNKTQEAVPIRTVSEPIITVKPKLTLFNKNYDDAVQIVPEVTKNFNTGTDANETDLSGIQFVKPKKSSSVSSEKSLLIARTQKSKLALMLSGLKGELDVDDEDEIDSKNTQTKETHSVTSMYRRSSQTEAVEFSPEINETDVNRSSSADTLKTTSITTTTTSSITSVQNSSIVGINSIITTNPSLAVTNAQINNIASAGSIEGLKFTGSGSPLTGIKLNPPISISEEKSKVSPSPSNSDNCAATKAAISSGGFSFGLTKPAENILTTSVTDISSIVTPNTTTVTEVTQSSLNSVALPIVSSTGNSANFSFGLSSYKCTTPNVPSSQSTLSNSIAMFTSATNTMALSPEVGSSLFGVKPSNAATVGNEANQISSSNPSSTFSFGLKTTTSTVTTTADNKLFSLVTTSITTHTMTNTPFTFGITPNSTNQNQKVITNTSAAGAFTFGGISSPMASVASKIGISNPLTATTGFTFNSISASKNLVAAKSESLKTPQTFTFGTISSTTGSGLVNRPTAFGVTPSSTNETIQSKKNEVSKVAAPGGGFAFGGFSTLNDSAAPKNAANSFLLASQPTTESSNQLPTFGAFGTAGLSVAPSKSLSVFGATKTNSTTASTSENIFAFGAPKVAATNETSSNVDSVKPFTFQSKTDNISSTPSLGGFAFNNTSALQSASQSSTSNVFGSPKPSFSFGNEISNSNSKPSIPPNNLFSSSVTATPQTPQNKTFSFGLNNESATSTNLFATSTVPTANEKPPDQIFSFNAAATNKPASCSNTFSFGNNKSATSNASSLFAFGKTSDEVQNAGVNKTFSFGSPAPTVSSATTSLFGVPTSVTSAPCTASSTNLNTTFQFSSTPSKPNENLFAASVAGSQQQPASERKIRRATRRLHKT